uniref:methylmalonyl-CoA mutase subunit beta n=2 Tax=Gelidibacter sp. TaxID=2018083 RepID=UPI00404985BC
MSKLSFNEFPEKSSKEWKQFIQMDLKGDDYNETLVWKTNEGINVKPFYHSDEFKSLPNISQTKATEWTICQSIFVANVDMSNKKAVDAINRGAESIHFILPSTSILIKDLLVNINLKITKIYIDCQFLSSEFLKQLAYFPDTENLIFFNDMIGNLARTGNWHKDLKTDHQDFDNVVLQTATFSIDAGLYQNAGATMVQQLAYGLAHANEYLNHLSNLSNEDKEHFKIVFKMSVGTNYFFEIAKLRALRLLWKTLASEYEMPEDCIIFATPTKRNKTLYDYNTNMLRTTTESMSAILGGANTVCNLPYDAIYHKDNEFGERIARNQLLVLKHESYFDKVDNPVDGTYYVETITQQLAEKALELFKDIETNSGFLVQLKEGIIQKKIKESATKEQEQFDKGEHILLGTNKHPNPNDKMKHELELYPFVKKNPIKTLIEPIIEKRLAEKIEQERLKMED